MLLNDLQYAVIDYLQKRKNKKIKQQMIKRHILTGKKEF